MIDTRLQLHWAAQAAAGVGRTLLAPQPDDSHHSFTWSGEHEALVGGIVEEHWQAGLRPRDCALLLIRGEVVDAYPLAGRTLDDGFAFYESRLGCTLVRPFEGLPEHPVAHGAKFAPDPDALARLARGYAEASRQLEGVRAAHREASPVRCWPHHFDIATLCCHGGDRTTGAGWSPGDAQVPEPYWYVTPWPYPDPSTLPPLAHGSWNTEGWVGAVLLGEGEVGAFLSEALQFLALGS